MAHSTILITGANSGIGKDVARQLALRAEVSTIYLACRNETKANAARAQLEAVTGKTIFEVVVMDVADPDSVRRALKTLDRPLDAVIMNAGGTGGRTPMTLTPEGVTEMFASNVLGHVVLLETLLAERRLTQVALFAGSEAARGVPKLRIKRPGFTRSSADELATVIDGSYFRDRKFDLMLAYGQTKYLGALWMSALARRHPDLRLITVSPGNTAGTEALSAMPLPMRITGKYVLPVVGPTLGVGHKLDVGARRFVTAINDPSLRSGVFYASAANKITGPLVDQSDIFPDLGNETCQDNAHEAIHRFIA
jgi:NAD(P)-dependent dehydrogenase (short-subunit alcohol dehydrogenase family)